MKILYCFCFSFFIFLICFFYTSISSGYPFALYNPDPTDINFTDIDFADKQISKKLDKNNTISL